MSRPTGKTTSDGQISVEDVVRLRDSLVTGLATLQTAVITHTNALLSGAPDSALDLLGLTKTFGNNVAGFRAPTPGLNQQGGDSKRKRNKKPTDPNAPKRPLTAYFLYLHSARPIIAKDLGEDATPGQVSAEATRRWTAMTEEDKQLWRDAYQQNRAEYRDRVAAYKAKAQGADPSAAQLAMENDAAADGADDDEDVVGSLEEIDEEVEVSPPASLKSSKRRKTDKDVSNTKNGARPSTVKETPILPPSFRDTVEVAAPESASKDRKKTPERTRKRSERKSRGGEDLEKAKEELRRSEEVEKEKRGGGERDKRLRRKRKSDVIDEE